MDVPLTMKFFVRITPLIMSLFVLFGCKSAPIVEADFKEAENKVNIHPSVFFERVVDNRLEKQKLTHTKQLEGTDILFLGDDAFTNSPLHQIAASLSTWLKRNPGKMIEVTSLLIHYGDEVGSKIVINHRPSSIDYLYGPGGLLLFDLFSSNYVSIPGGYNVVVQLSVNIDNAKHFVQHVQSPVSQTSQTELITAAIDFTSYKLSQKLLDI